MSYAYAALQRLEIEVNGLKLYAAGWPKFMRTFPRDCITSALFLEDLEKLRNIVLLGALKQGRKQDPSTGEEPGKIIHDYPGEKLGGKHTAFSGEDETALWLIGLHRYVKRTGDWRFVEELWENLEMALEYLFKHLNSEYAFEIDPSFYGADKPLFPVPTWKDNWLIVEREDGFPRYPAVSLLLQAQYVKGLRCASELMGSKDLAAIAKRMKDYLVKHLFDGGDVPTVVIDREGHVKQYNSDVLHMLYYLEKEDLSLNVREKIAEAGKPLKTQIGFKASVDEACIVKAPSWLEAGYHQGGSVWPVDNLTIFEGALRFGLEEAAKVALKIYGAIKKAGTYPELFYVKGEEAVPAGCEHQLWTVVAAIYFERMLQQRQRLRSD